MLCDGTYLVPLRWRGGRIPGPARRVAWVVRAGWLESAYLFTYSPLSSRAKRGDPVNKKKHCGRIARRHIALDCHSRTTTFSTLNVLLRNDRGESARAITKRNAPRPPGGGCRASRDGGGAYVPRRWRGQHLHSILYTLLLSRCARQ